jgi:lipopolysaccharide transport protein LptA
MRSIIVTVGLVLLGVSGTSYALDDLQLLSISSTSIKLSARYVTRQGVFSGSVRLALALLTATAERVTVMYESAPSQSLFLMQGFPARFTDVHSGAWAQGSAQQIDLIPNRRLLVLRGKAQLMIGNHTIRGEEIHYRIGWGHLPQSFEAPIDLWLVGSDPSPNKGLARTP